MGMGADFFEPIIQKLEDALKAMEQRAKRAEIEIARLKLEMEDGKEIANDLIRAMEQLTENKKGLDGEWWRPSLATARVWVARNKT